MLHEGDYVSLMEAIAGAMRSGANLSGAYLSGANLSGADLYGSNLSVADLYRSNLSGSNLSGCNLYEANLSGSNLSGANLSGANLYEAKFDLTEPSAKLAWLRTRILPSDGDIVGWKKSSDGKIIKLLILGITPRSHAFGRKCRCAEALVTEIWMGTKEVEIAYTFQHGPKTPYEVGKVVKADGWNPDWTFECGQGIHFYITREEAEAHS